MTGVTANATYTYNITTFDVDGDPLAFSAVALPDWLSLVPGQQNAALLEGAPDIAQVGVHEVNIEVSDGEVTVAQVFSVTVVEGAPSEPQPEMPANGAMDVATAVMLTWNVLGASSFDLQVAFDSTFGSVYLEEIGLLTAGFELTALDANTQYYWRVRGVNEAGTSSWSASYRFTTARDTGVDDVLSNAPFMLHPNYPNPFSRQTSIPFTLDNASTAPIELAVYDLRGRKIVTLEAGAMVPGQHAIVWRGEDAAGAPLASGTYVVKLQQGAARTTRLVVLVR